MGNSKLAAGCHLPGAASDPSPAAGANGILGRIQGDHIAAGLQTLGRATAAESPRGVNKRWPSWHGEPPREKKLVPTLGSDLPGVLPRRTKAPR